MYRSMNKNSMVVFGKGALPDVGVPPSSLINSIIIGSSVVRTC